MSLRPPNSPRATTVNQLSSAGSTPSSLPAVNFNRRASNIGSIRPSSALGRSKDEMESLKEAMLKNDPGRYGSNSPQLSDSPSPSKGSIGASTNNNEELRKRVMRRPSTVNLRTPSSLLARSTNGTTTPEGFKVPRAPRTPAAVHNQPRPMTPTNPLARSTNSFGSTAARFTATKEPTTTRVRALVVGDGVTLDVTGTKMEGVMRFLGSVEGKDGIWAGIELDDEFHGRGKNDGSVKGTQYFQCPALSGLFVPLSKLTKKPAPARSQSRASSTTDHPATATLTEGSRASKYVGVTATELTKKRLAAKAVEVIPKPTGTPTKLTRDILAASTNSISTPRAIKPRMSIGVPTMRTPRKSLGAPTPVRPPVGYTSTLTPRASLSSSVNNRIRNVGASNTTPDVPPLPSDFDGRRSVTPAQKRMSSSTASTVGRRLSTANLAEHYSSARPQTPSIRSVSRQSFASSISRQSHSQLFDNDGVEDLKKAKEETRDAREREGEAKKLLEGSERLGREMENKLGEKEDALARALERVIQLELEIERAIELEAQRLEGVGGEQGTKEMEEERVRQLEMTLEQVKESESQVKIELMEARQESEEALLIRQGELDSIKERMILATNEAEVERFELTRQLDALREAGQSLCEMYEVRLAKLDEDRIEAIELAELLTTRLEDATALLPQTNGGDSSPLIASSSSMARTPTAEMINVENALADLEHMRGKVMALEDQLEEVRASLEMEVEDAQKRKTKASDVEAALRKEIKAAKESAGKSPASLDGSLALLLILLRSHAITDLLTQSEARLNNRIEELDLVIVESEIALENERSEVETLRADATSSSSIALADEAKRASKEIVTLKTERATAMRDLELAKRETQETNQHVEQLRQDLRAAEKEIDRHHRERAVSLESDQASTIVEEAHRQELDSRDKEIESLRIRLDHINTPSKGTTPTNQDTPASSSLSPPHTSSPGINGAMLNGSANRRSLIGKDDIGSLKEQIVGLKVIIVSMGEENAELLKKNRSSLTEIKETRDGQKALEATIENLIQEMSSGVKSDQPYPVMQSTNNAPLEREIKELKAKLQHSEKRSAREIKALNQEVSELESLVESKIFHEDELESEVRKYRAIAERNGLAPDTMAPQLPTHADRKSVPSTSNSEDECEMCGMVGHGVEACPDFGSPSKVVRPKSPRSSSDYCDDCEEYGHSLDLCPMANEMF